MKKFYFSLILGAFIALLLPQASFAAFGGTATFFGRQYNPEGAGIGPLDSYLDNPHGFAESDSGDIIIADTNNNVLRLWSASTKKIFTFAGTGQYGQTDGFRLLIQFSQPYGITIAHNNDIYIADTGNSAIRMIPAATDTDGDGYGDIVRTIVSSADGLRRPQDVMIRGNELFIADTGNNRVVRTDLDGKHLSLVEGNLPTPTKIDWYADRILVLMAGNQSIEEFRLSVPVNQGRRNRLVGGFQGLGAMGIRGSDLYVTSGKQGVANEIWKVDLNSSVKDQKTLLQNRGETEMLNNGSGIRFRNVAGGSDEMVMVFEGGSSLYRFDAADGDNPKILAGKYRYMNEYGSRAETMLGRPHAMTMSPDGLRMYMAVNHRIVEFNLASGQSRFVAGFAMDNYVEATGEEARFSDPTQIVMAANGRTLYIVDRNNHRIRSLNTSTGKTAYITGAGEINAFGTDNGYQEGSSCASTFTAGAAGCAYFNRPTGIALSSDEKTLYVADASNNIVRKVVIATGATSFIAGAREAGFADGVGSAARFNGPFSLALASNGVDLYVTDKSNHAIRRVNVNTGVVTTVVGKGVGGYAEGNAETAYLNIPEYIHMGSDGKLYFTEAGNFRIRRIDLGSGQTQLVSGTGKRGVANGDLNAASWGQPKGLYLRGTTLYVSDHLNDMVRSVDVAQ